MFLTAPSSAAGDMGLNGSVSFLIIKACGGFVSSSATAFSPRLSSSSVTCRDRATQASAARATLAYAPTTVHAGAGTNPCTFAIFPHNPVISVSLEKAFGLYLAARFWPVMSF